MQKNPLCGRSLVLTRPREDAASMARRLRALGARVILHPVIAFRACPESAAMRAFRAGEPARRCDWIAFTSANAVRFFAAFLGPAGARRALGRAKIAAVGPATARALRALGTRPALVPEDFSAGGLAAAFAARGGMKGARVLFPCARGARETLPLALEKMGALVRPLVLYEAVPAPPPRRRMDCNAVDAVVFMSPSAVEAFAAGQGKGEARKMTALALCIGPVTARAARKYFRRVRAAREHSEDGLVAALLAALG